MTKKNDITSYIFRAKLLLFYFLFSFFSFFKKKHRKDQHYSSINSQWRNNAWHGPWGLTNILWRLGLHKKIIFYKYLSLHKKIIGPCYTCPVSFPFLRSHYSFFSFDFYFFSIGFSTNSSTLSPFKNIRLMCVGLCVHVPCGTLSCFWIVN